MAHVHAGEDRTAYFMDQLCTIGFCGAIGVVQILLWHYDILKQILVPGFHIPVLISGISLTILALVRGTYLWLSVGAETGEQKQADCCDHDHGHVHEHDHQHEHGHDHEHQGIVAAEHVHHAHDHSHAPGQTCDHHHDADHKHAQSHGDDCGHDHGWAPWRYVVLLLPILFFLLGIPQPPSKAGPPEPLEPGVIEGDFKFLHEAPYNAAAKNEYEGKVVRMHVRYSSPGPDSQIFIVFREKMTCCAGDAYPIPFPVQSSIPPPAFPKHGKWLYVTGVVEFRKMGAGGELRTILKMRKPEDLRLASPPAVPFVQ